jgi:hypothetical protein
MLRITRSGQTINLYVPIRGGCASGVRGFAVNVVEISAYLLTIAHKSRYKESGAAAGTPADFQRRSAEDLVLPSARRPVPPHPSDRQSGGTEI